MISRQHRFKGHTSVQKVRSRPSRGPGFSIFAQANKRPWRAAVVVSKKVHKSAVVRNRIRRRIYEMLRLYDKAHSLQNIDIVCIIYDASLAMVDFETLQKSFNKSLESALKQAQDTRTRS